MKLTLETIRDIREEDHWEILEKLERGLKDLSSQVGTILKGMNLEEVGEARKELSPILANLEVYKEIIKLKLAVSHIEWEEKTSEALVMIKKEYISEKELFLNMEF